MHLKNIKLSVIFFLFLGTYAFGKSFSIQDLKDIFNNENTVKFNRVYKGQDFHVEAKLFEFVRTGEITWIVGETQGNYISCPVPTYITKYDNFRVGELVLMRGTIFGIGHSPRTNPALDLYVGCYLSKI